jgi:outer membrane protein OmpA-like peptidoglycan-associated protein
MFIEGSAGAALLIYDGEFYPLFSGGLKAGIRFALKDWYIEPAIRGGYPHIIGVALTAGYVPHRKKSAGDSKRVTVIPLEKDESAAIIPLEKDESAAVIPPEAPKEETVSPGEIPVEKLPEDIKLDIVIQFRAGITRIDDGEMGKLKKLGEKLREYPAQRIRIAGYCAATGSINAQLSNSSERARGVADYLIRNGYAESERVDIAGYGAENPLAPNNSPANRVKNDRVEVIILKD